MNGVGRDKRRYIKLYSQKTKKRVNFQKNVNISPVIII